MTEKHTSPQTNTAHSNAQNLEHGYQQVVALYDYAENIISTIIQAPQDDQEALFHLVNPLVEQMEESADILTEEFVCLAEGKANAKEATAATANRGRIETAFRKIYTAMDDYHKRATKMNGLALEFIEQHTSPLVEAIKRHIEQVVAIFAGFIDMALERMMQKADLELLRKREEKIAQMMHNASMLHGKG